MYTVSHRMTRTRRWIEDGAFESKAQAIAEAKQVKSILGIYWQVRITDESGNLCSWK